MYVVSGHAWRKDKQKKYIVRFIQSYVLNQ